MDLRSRAGRDRRDSGRRTGWTAVPGTVGAIVLVAAAVTVGDVGSLAGVAPVTVPLALGLVGMVGHADPEVDELVDLVRRLADGEDVDVPTDRTGSVGRLYDAMDDLTQSVRERDRYRDAVSRIAAAEELSTDEQLRRLLALGRDHLDVESAYLAHVEAAENRYVVARTVGSDVVPAGAERPLDCEFCRRTVPEDGVVDVADATAEDWGEAVGRIGSYVGAGLPVDGETEAVLCFVDPDPRAGPRSSAETAFVELVASQIGHVCDRRERERRLGRYRQLVESAGDPMTVLSADGHYEVINDALADFLGRSREELLGREAATFNPEDVRERFESQIRELLRDDAKEWGQLEVEMTDDEGNEHIFEARVGLLRDENGEFDGSVTTFRDVTERVDRERELAEHRKYTDDILDAVPDLFFVLDESGYLQRCNRTVTEETGYAESELESMHAVEFFDDRVDRADVDAVIDEVFETGSATVEAPLRTKEGESIPFEFVAVAVENPDGEREFAAIGRDISERRRREAELERTAELLEHVQRIADVGGWEIDLTTENNEVVWTDHHYRLLGLDPSASIDGLEDTMEFVSPEDERRLREASERAIVENERYDIEFPVTTATGEHKWIHSIGEPVRKDGETVKLRGSIQDVTERKRRERTLRVLHEASRSLLRIDDESEVADLAVSTAESLLDRTEAAVYLLDSAAGELVPAAHTDGFGPAGRGATPVAVGDDDSAVWNAFATSARQVFDEQGEGGLDEEFGDGEGGGLVVPIGDHGVFVVTSSDAVDERTRRLAETMVATTEVALDRIESEATLRERDAELADRNQRLRRQIQLTNIIRRIDRSLVTATSREEIESAVCEGLAEAEDVAFAWLGSVDPEGGALEPRTWAGVGGTYLDATSLSIDPAVSEPAAATARSGEATVVETVVENVGGETWRRHALEAGFQSALAVPIAVDEYRYGVLAVYADRTDVFGDLERTVFAELGRTIANAIDAVRTREALHADTLVELRLRLEGESFLARLANCLDEAVEYVSVATDATDRSRLIFAVEGEAAVRSALEEMVSVEEFRLLSDGPDRRVYEATVTGTVLPATLIRHGARPQSVRASPTGVAATVHLPTSTSVREFVEMLRETHDVELRGRRNVTRATQTRAETVTDLLESLTDRQREVLRTAYYAGFFEWPRGSSGEEIADMLDVSQPTVSRHLRLGQHRLLSELFEADPGTSASPD